MNIVEQARQRQKEDIEKEIKKPKLQKHQIEYFSNRDLAEIEIDTLHALARTIEDSKNEGEMELKQKIIDELQKRELRTKNYRRSTIPQSVHIDGENLGSLTFSQVQKEIEQYIPNSTIPLKIALAIIASSNFRQKVMLWLLFVGVPSSGKTEILRLFKHSMSVYFLDSFTLNAFISGERETEKQKVHDLLPQINNKCLIIKDWTVVFSLDERMTKKILGDMVGSYDEELTKFSTRRGQITYDSYFSQLGAITPATLNKHTNYLNMVGPRFIFYTMPDLNEEQEEQSFKNIFSQKDRKKTERELSQLISAYIDLLSLNSPIVKEIDDKYQQEFRVASRLMARGRGIVIMNAAIFEKKEGDNIEKIRYYELEEVQIEHPFRAIQQLILLAEYLAYVSNKEEITQEEMAIIKEVVISSMPAARSQALRVIINMGGVITAKILAESDNFEKSTKTARRLLDELTYLKILKKEQTIGGTIPAGYEIREEFKNFLIGTEDLKNEDSTVHTGENMTPYSNELEDLPF